MRGTIFLAFEYFVVDRWGYERWETIYLSVLPNLETQTPFVSPATYPYDDFLEIFSATAILCKQEHDALEKDFGRHLFKTLHERMGQLVDCYKDVRSLLENLDGVVQAEFRKLLPNAMLPSFNVVDRTERTLTLRYSSPRKLFALVEGLIEGAAAHFGSTVSITRAPTPGDDPSARDFTIEFGEFVQ